MANVNTSGSAENLERVPPNSIQAEACVLGSMMLDAQAIDLVVELLCAEQFYRPAHQLIFKVLLEMHQHSQAVDLVTVREELQQRNQLETIGGVEYLVALAEGVPSAANVEYYAKTARDKAMLRELISATGQINQEAYTSHDEATSVVDRAEQRIFQIAQQHIGDESVSLRDVLESAFEQLQDLDGSQLTGLGSGYDSLDGLTCGFQPGEMIILAARPSMGKTSMLLNIAEHMAVVDKVPVALYSMEMSGRQLALRFLASHARFDLKQLRRGLISDEQWTNLQIAADDLNDAPLMIDDSPIVTILQLRARARRLVAQHGVKCILIDYLQLMTYTGSANSRQEQITEISRGIKALARELEIPVITAAQLNRGPADRPTHRPRMSDLRESGSLEQDADVVMLLHNEDYFHRGEPDYMPTNLTELIIAKQRNGPTGVVNLMFHPAYTCFVQMAPDSYVPHETKVT